MSEHYPRIVAQGKRWQASIRTGLNLAFYLPPRHPEFVEDVLRALDVYRRYTGPDALLLYEDREGDWYDLDEAGWDVTRRALREPSGWGTNLQEKETLESRYAFNYYGRTHVHLTPTD